MRCAPHKMRSYLFHVLSRSFGYAKMTAKQPSGLFGGRFGKAMRTEKYVI